MIRSAVRALKQNQYRHGLGYRKGVFKGNAWFGGPSGSVVELDAKVTQGPRVLASGCRRGIP
jgi:hypothetical protein